MEARQEFHPMGEQGTNSNRSVFIDIQNAIRIATRFLEQHHSIIATDAVLSGDRWVITARTGTLPHKVKTILVDAKSGMLIQCI